MKKLLLATSALVGLAVLAEPAAAQVTVTLGGSLRFGAVWYDDDESAAETAAGGLREFEFYTNTEIVVRADGKADNGLTYGAYIEMEADQRGDVDNGDSSDEVNLYVAGGWGRIELGDQDGVSDVFGGSITAPSGYGTGGWDGDWGQAGVRNSLSGGNTVREFATNSSVEFTTPKNPDSGDSTKITYYTPNFAGFQAGVSYVPQNGSEGQNVNRFERTGGFQDFIEAGVRYSGAFAGATVNVGATGTWAEGTAPLAGGAAIEDLFAYQVGAQVGYAGFLVGGSYMNAADSGLAPGAFDDDNEVWAAGVQYTTGPIVVGVSYLSGEHEGSTAVAANDEYEAWYIGATYTIAPGFTTGLDVVLFESDEEQGTAFDNEGTIVLLSTRVAF